RLQGLEELSIRNRKRHREAPAGYCGRTRIGVQKVRHTAECGRAGVDGCCIDGAGCGAQVEIDIARSAASLKGHLIAAAHRRCPLAKPGKLPGKTDRGTEVVPIRLPDG